MKKVKGSHTLILQISRNFYIYKNDVLAAWPPHSNNAIVIYAYKLRDGKLNMFINRKHTKVG